MNLEWSERSTLAHELCHIIYDGAEQLKSLHVDFDEDMADYAASANDDVERWKVNEYSDWKWVFKHVNAQN